MDANGLSKYHKLQKPVNKLLINQDFPYIESTTVIPQVDKGDALKLIDLRNVERTNCKVKCTIKANTRVSVLSKNRK